MAKRGVPLEFQDIEETTIDGQFEDVSNIERDLEDDLNAIFAEIGDENEEKLTVRVYRILPNGGKDAYLFTCSPADFPGLLDRLRDDYQGGKFEIRVMKNNRYYKRKYVCIETLKRSAMPAAASNDLTSLATLMNDGFNRMADAMAERHHAPPPDPMEMQSKMLEQMIAMKEFLGGGQPAAAPASDPLEAFKVVAQIKDLVKDEGEGSTGANVNDVLLKLAENYLPQLAEASKREQELHHEAMRPRKQNPAPRKPAPQPKPEASPTPQEQETNIPIMQHLAFLIEMAKKDFDPLTYAHVVVDNTPEESLPDLLGLVQSDNALDMLMAVQPDVQHYPGWFKELGECIEQMLTGGGESDAEGEHVPNEDDEPVTSDT